ncbi:hypothetical protein [Candidatus Odyssella thessalonicensis]|uniref:hypothetical protein n=1 Tax=Candidatus Odyssella thessalonicensis TaxID=84647 RepID=UPI000225A8D8|nr:hypothetical protein [Candidatus Odyssella thessalonicensis]
MKKFIVLAASIFFAGQSLANPSPLVQRSASQAEDSTSANSEAHGPSTVKVTSERCPKNCQQAGKLLQQIYELRQQIETEKQQHNSNYQRKTIHPVNPSHFQGQCEASCPQLLGIHKQINRFETELAQLKARHQSSSSSSSSPPTDKCPKNCQQAGKLLQQIYELRQQIETEKLQHNPNYQRKTIHPMNPSHFQGQCEASCPQLLGIRKQIQRFEAKLAQLKGLHPTHPNHQILPSSIPQGQCPKNCHEAGEILQEIYQLRLAIEKAKHERDASYKMRPIKQPNLTPSTLHCHPTCPQITGMTRQLNQYRAELAALKGNHPPSSDAALEGQCTPNCDNEIELRQEIRHLNIQLELRKHQINPAYKMKTFKEISSDLKKGKRCAVTCNNIKRLEARKRQLDQQLTHLHNGGNVPLLTAGGVNTAQSSVPYTHQNSGFINRLRKKRQNPLQGSTVNFNNEGLSISPQIGTLYATNGHHGEEIHSHQNGQNYIDLAPGSAVNGHHSAEGHSNQTDQSYIGLAPGSAVNGHHSAEGHSNQTGQSYIGLVPGSAANGHHVEEGHSNQTGQNYIGLAPASAANGHHGEEGHPYLTGQNYLSPSPANAGSYVGAYDHNNSYSIYDHNFNSPLSHPNSNVPGFNTPQNGFNTSGSSDGHSLSLNGNTSNPYSSNYNNLGTSNGYPSSMGGYKPYLNSNHYHKLGSNGNSSSYLNNHLPHSYNGEHDAFEGADHSFEASHGYHPSMNDYSNHPHNNEYSHPETADSYHLQMNHYNSNTYETDYNNSGGAGSYGAGLHGYGNNDYDGGYNNAGNTGNYSSGMNHYNSHTYDTDYNNSANAGSYGSGMNGYGSNDYGSGYNNTGHNGNYSSGINNSNNNAYNDDYNNIGSADGYGSGMNGYGDNDYGSGYDSAGNTGNYSSGMNGYDNNTYNGDYNTMGGASSYGSSMNGYTNNAYGSNGYSSMGGAAGYGAGMGGYGASAYGGNYNAFGGAGSNTFGMNGYGGGSSSITTTVSGGGVYGTAMQGNTEIFHSNTKESSKEEAKGSETNAMTAFSSIFSQLLGGQQASASSQQQAAASSSPMPLPAQPGLNQNNGAAADLTPTQDDMDNFYGASDAG